MGPASRIAVLGLSVLLGLSAPGPRAAAAVETRLAVQGVASNDEASGAAQSEISGAAPSEASSVPDVLARAAGLRLAPLPQAERLYALNCQGCHGASGVSVAEIPTLARRVGYFARIADGRRYLIEVPNVALSAASDADVAAIMNYVLLRFSRAELPEGFKPYTAAEVRMLRRARIDPAMRRRQVVAELLAARRIPSALTLALPTVGLY